MGTCTQKSGKTPWAHGKNLSDTCIKTQVKAVSPDDDITRKGVQVPLRTPLLTSTFGTDRNIITRSQYPRNRKPPAKTGNNRADVGTDQAHLSVSRRQRRHPTRSLSAVFRVPACLHLCRALPWYREGNHFRVARCRGLIHSMRTTSGVIIPPCAVSVLPELCWRDNCVANHRLQSDPLL